MYICNRHRATIVRVRRRSGRWRCEADLVTIATLLLSSLSVASPRLASLPRLHLHLLNLQCPTVPRVYVAYSVWSISIRTKISGIAWYDMLDRPRREKKAYIQDPAVTRFSSIIFHKYIGKGDYLEYLHKA